MRVYLDTVLEAVELRKMGQPRRDKGYANDVYSPPSRSWQSGSQPDRLLFTIVSHVSKENGGCAGAKVAVRTRATAVREVREGQHGQFSQGENIPLMLITSRMLRDWEGYRRGYREERKTE